MDKDKNVIDKMRVGYIKQLSLVQLKKADIEDFLLVDAIKGTGIRVDHYNILSITNKGFLNLWDGLSYERSAPGLIAPDDNYEIKASAAFENIDGDDNLELIYQKKIVKYYYLPKTEQFKAEPASTRTEIYKLRETYNKQKFTLEKNSRIDAIVTKEGPFIRSRRSCPRRCPEE